MKRKSNLYNNILNFENILAAYSEVTKNTRNPRKIMLLKEYKAINVYKIYNMLLNKTYSPGPYNVFTIYEPKERRIVSQNIHDKVVNHLIARFILYPTLMPQLINENIASRPNLGTKKGYELHQKFRKICNAKYTNYYILKCDISKFFASIDHEILKKKLVKVIKDKDALDILFKVIDNDKEGLSIGSMTSQTLAIFYLNDLDHYIKEVLKIKYYVRYQDDFLLFHKSKEYLKYCLNEIRSFLEKEKLSLNSKTRIYKNSDNFIFLGRTTKNKPAKYRNVKRKMSKLIHLYNNGCINLHSIASSLICYNSTYESFLNKDTNTKNKTRKFYKKKKNKK